jgi:hypothetical protein
MAVSAQREEENMKCHDIPQENHDQFVMRAMHVFPADEAENWSRLERGLFNSLMGKLIFQHGYAGITEPMLAEVRRQMQAAVRRYEESRVAI